MSQAHFFRYIEYIVIFSLTVNNSIKEKREMKTKNAPAELKKNNQNSVSMGAIRS